MRPRESYRPDSSPPSIHGVHQPGIATPLLDRHVWVADRERTWMLGGTFLVVRRIALALEAWRALPVAEQERVIGRRRDSGAPLGAARESDPLQLEALAPDAHVRLAARETNPGVTMLRRSYSFDGGLLFLAFQQDPRRQFVAVQRRLAGHDALAAYSTHVGSAVFAIPPGARPGRFLAADMFRG